MMMRWWENRKGHIRTDEEEADDEYNEEEQKINMKDEEGHLFPDKVKWQFGKIS